MSTPRASTRTRKSNQNGSCWTPEKADKDEEAPVGTTLKRKSDVNKQKKSAKTKKVTDKKATDKDGDEWVCVRVCVYVDVCVESKTHDEQCVTES